MNKHNDTVSTFELLEKFPNERAAIKHLEHIRWGGKPICPHCLERGQAVARRSVGRAPGLYRCKACRKEYTVRHGTIFERSHIKLHKWMYAIYILQTARKGISSLQLSKELGITQKSAWFMLHRLREACSVQAVKLTGIVEVDETYLGGREKNKHAGKKLKSGRGPPGKWAVMGLRECKGRVRSMPVDNTDKGTMQKWLLKQWREVPLFIQMTLAITLECRM